MAAPSASPNSHFALYGADAYQPGRQELPLLRSRGSLHSLSTSCTDRSLVTTPYCRSLVEMSPSTREFFEARAPQTASPTVGLRRTVSERALGMRVEIHPHALRTPPPTPPPDNDPPPDSTPRTVVDAEMPWLQGGSSIWDDRRSCGAYWRLLRLAAKHKYSRAVCPPSHINKYTLRNGGFAPGLLVDERARAQALKALRAAVTQDPKNPCMLQLWHDPRARPVGCGLGVGVGV